MSLSRFPFKTKFSLRPDRFAENLNYHECSHGPVKMERMNKLRRVLLPQTVQAPVRFACFLLQVYSADLIGYSRDQSYLDM